MTTIVADTKRGIIAADSRITTANDLTQYAAEKLYRVGKSVFGGAGDVEDELRFRRWMLDGQPKKGRPVFNNDSFNVLELDKDGIVLWDHTLAPQRLNEEVFAIGSGARIALYIIRTLGKTAEEAIDGAATIDIHTAGPVQVLKLRERE